MNPSQQALSQPILLNISVVDLLADRIFSGMLKAGQRLNESELARQLKISRSPIREALHSLEQQGIVTGHPRRGMFVVKLTEREVKKINSVRTILEAEALRLCKQRFNADIERRLTQYLERMRTADPSISTFVRRTDLEFHRSMWNHCGNEFLAATLVRLTAPLFVYVVETLNRGQRRRKTDHLPLLRFLQGQTHRSAEDIVSEHVNIGYGSFEAGDECDSSPEGDWATELVGTHSAFCARRKASSF